MVRSATRLAIGQFGLVLVGYESLIFAKGGRKFLLPTTQVKIAYMHLKCQQQNWALFCPFPILIARPDSVCILTVALPSQTAAGTGSTIPSIIGGNVAISTGTGVLRSMLLGLEDFLP